MAELSRQDAPESVVTCVLAGQRRVDAKDGVKKMALGRAVGDLSEPRDAAGVQAQLAHGLGRERSSAQPQAHPPSQRFAAVALALGPFGSPLLGAASQVFEALGDLVRAGAGGGIRIGAIEMSRRGALRVRAGSDVGSSRHCQRARAGNDHGGGEP